MSDLIGGPCPHGVQPAVQCADCVRDQLSAAQAERDEYRSELEMARERVAASEPNRKDMQEHATQLARERDTASAERDEARAQVADLRSWSCESPTCKWTLGDVDGYDDSTNNSVPGYWVCGHCWAKAMDNRSARDQRIAQRVIEAVVEMLGEVYARANGRAAGTYADGVFAAQSFVTAMGLDRALDDGGEG